MIRCRNCSAHLDGYNSRCGYCGSVNDLDRDLLIRGQGPSRKSKFDCPVCAEPMEHLALGQDGEEAVTADRCGKCFGLLFPFYKLETVLNDIAKFGFLIDAKRLEDLTRNTPLEAAIAYRKCPVCGKFMNRINFGQRSGVITDQCHGHGVWLDAGELRRLVEWKNSGGMLHAEEMRKQLEREQEKRRQREKEKLARLKRQAPPDSESDY
ncbi:MAG: zf-TFIIB domain-containing protein [Fibrobacterota bacterium]|nr:zf-TFIIB domain-containing protein [Fibrobacterota bacterium]